MYNVFINLFSEYLEHYLYHEEDIDQEDIDKYERVEPSFMDYDVSNVFSVMFWQLIYLFLVPFTMFKEVLFKFSLYCNLQFKFIEYCCFLLLFSDRVYMFPTVHRSGMQCWYLSSGILGDAASKITLHLSRNSQERKWSGQTSEEIYCRTKIEPIPYLYFQYLLDTSYTITENTQNTSRST